jgi:hypothetical protein
VQPGEILPMIARLARIDALAKGIGAGDARREMLDLALALCGVHALGGAIA